MNELIKSFWFPTLLWIAGLIGVYFWAGWGLFLIVIFLTILEVTLSFDNAVVNARVLEKMNEVWRQRFLTWGIFIAVFVTRFVLPIIIVAVTVWASPVEIAKLALFDPAQYGHLLEGAHYAIASFGGAFLLMVALKYFFDDAKETHWIAFIEKHASQWGQIEAIAIAMSLAVIAFVGISVPAHTSEILFAGIIGVMLFILMQGISSLFSDQAKGVEGDIARGSFAMFMYLEVLDAAFSLDAVIGAFAITTNLVAIAIGLGVGAFFVRSITLHLVKHKTLDELVYLEHGAHWAILGLALSMLVSLFVEVPEVVTGLIGMVFIFASYYSSTKERKKAKHG